MASTATKKKTPSATEVTGACGLILAMKPAEFSEKGIRTIVGDRVLGSMSQVAQEFGISHGTVRQSWRANGMPGGNGVYDLADILFWRLSHEKKNAATSEAAKGEGTENTRLKNEKLRLEVAEMMDKKQIKDGQMVLRSQVISESYARNAVSRRMLLEVPRALLPMMPEEWGSKVAAELTKLLKNVMHAMAAKSYKAYMREAQEEERTGKRDL